MNGYRGAYARFLSAVESSWLAKLGAAAGFAGLTAILAQISVPLPWTPVPFTFQMAGVFLSGVMLGPRYGVAAMLLYLGAGALGLHVFAPSADAFNPDGLVVGDRWRVLVPDAVAKTGFTAGYLLGFPLAALFVGSYVRRRSQGEGAKLVRAAAWLLSLLLVAVAGGAFFLGSGGTFRDSDSGAAYQSGADAAWLLAGAFLVLAPLLAWFLSRTNGPNRDFGDSGEPHPLANNNARLSPNSPQSPFGRRGRESLDLFVVLLGATAVVHILGVLVLAPTLGLTWTRAAALGSAVFLPFDALKAALAVLLAPAFLPSAPPSPPPRGETP